jgi:hypothetical protein
MPYLFCIVFQFVSPLYEFPNEQCTSIESQVRISREREKEREIIYILFVILNPKSEKALEVGKQIILNVREGY